MGASDGLLLSLSGWDTPALSNAIRRRIGVDESVACTDGSTVRVSGESFVGYAVTAQMSAAPAGGTEVPVRDLHAAIIAATGPVVVMLEDVDGSPGQGAFLGEVNGTLLDALGVAGFVTNGRVRDVNELRAFGYPIFAQGLCVARRHMHLTRVSGPVTVSGLTVSPGDLIHADEHGVLRLPGEDSIDGVLEEAQNIREEEQRIVKWARSAGFTHEGLLGLKRVRH